MGEGFGLHALADLREAGPVEPVEATTRHAEQAGQVTVLLHRAPVGFETLEREPVFFPPLSQREGLLDVFDQLINDQVLERRLEFGDDREFFAGDDGLFREHRQQRGVLLQKLISQAHDCFVLECRLNLASLDASGAVQAHASSKTGDEASVAANNQVRAQRVSGQRQRSAVARAHAADGRDELFDDSGVSVQREREVDFGRGEAFEAGQKMRGV